MNIVISPDPILREKCEPVEIGDDSVRILADDMLKLMYEADGVGLAAPQVGLLKRMVVIDTDYATLDEAERPLPKNPLVFINPEIIDHSSDKVKSTEGCLSLPGINVDVDRWAWVKVRCLDENFNEVIREGDGLFGRCMQHELDHLDGITLFERLGPFARIRALHEYGQALAAGAQPGDVSA